MVPWLRSHKPTPPTINTPKPERIRRIYYDACQCGGRKTFVSEMCFRCRSEAHRLNRRKAVKRGGDHIARARRLGLQTEMGVTGIRVFERDGWRCQICKKRTPARLRGLRKPDSPTLDHITPISKGGGHTWSNVQCACWACNSSKGATVLGQFRLAI
jgi:5-methylcytosine-specific restriction endonuclease McrA